MLMGIRAHADHEMPEEWQRTPHNVGVANGKGVESTNKQTSHVELRIDN
jgi:hypothetical protein